MKVELTEAFLNTLLEQVEFIALDKPLAARKFNNDLLAEINKIPNFPKQHRRSIYFDNGSIRDLIFKGYTIVYKIDRTQNIIQVFGFIKHSDKL